MNGSRALPYGRACATWATARGRPGGGSAPAAGAGWRRSEEASGSVPKVEHLDIEHAAQHAHELLRRPDPRPDERELAQAREALERARVLEKVVVEVQHAHVRDQPREVRRQRRQAARRELQVDQVVAGLREEAGCQRVSCAKTR